MPKTAAVAVCAFLLLSACGGTPVVTHEPEQVAAVRPAAGEGQATEPRVGPSNGQPVETAPPNVPEFKPAFAQQTRAPAVHTQTPFKVTELAQASTTLGASRFCPTAACS